MEKDDDLNEKNFESVVFDSKFFIYDFVYYKGKIPEEWYYERYEDETWSECVSRHRKAKILRLLELFDA